MKELAKKAIKKIVAVGMGTTILASSVFAAVATDLSDYPSPFVKDGVFNGEIVVGEKAQVADVVGAIDIAASLQYAMKTVASEGSVSSQGGKIIVETGAAGVEGGVVLEGQSSDSLYLGEDSVQTLDDEDLSVILKEGTFKDDDGDDESGNELTATEDETDYTQKLIIGNSSVAYDLAGDVETPAVYFNMENKSRDAYTLEVEFGDAVNFEALTDDESIELAGKTFTVSSDTTEESLVLFASDITHSLELKQAVEVTVDGKTYEVELTGADSEGDEKSVIIRVGADKAVLEAGDTEEIGGLSIHAQDVFVTNIPSLTASANIFIGSDEITIKDGEAIEMGQEDLDSYVVNIADGTDFTNVTKLEFVYTPADAEDETEDYLFVGDELVDPFFGTFKMSFAGMSEELDANSKSEVTVAVASKNEIKVDFTNEAGDEVSATLYKDGAVEDFVISGTNLVEDERFFANDGDDFFLFEVVDINNAGDEVKIKNVVTDETKTYEAGDDLKDSDLSISAITTDNITLSAAVDATVKAKGGSTILFEDGNITITEDITDAEDVTNDATMKFELYYDAADEEYEVQVESGISLIESEDDNFYGVTEFGSYITLDEDGTELKVYIPKEEEVLYNVAIAPTDAAGTTAATEEYTEGDVLAGVGKIKAITAGEVAAGGMAINKIALPLAKLDSETAIGDANQIIVGGPAVNKLSADAIGVTFPSYGLTSGLFSGEGEAVIKLVEQGSNVAIVVAGYEAVDTIRATTALANAARGDVALEGMAVTVSTSNKIEAVVAKAPVVEDNSTAADNSTQAE